MPDPNAESKKREGLGRLFTVQEMYQRAGFSPEEAQRRSEERELRAREERVRTAIDEIVDALGLRGSGEGVVIAIGPEGSEGPPPSPQELAAMLAGDGGGCPGDCGCDCPRHKAAALVADALAKVGTSAGANRGWSTKKQVQPPKPATEELETPAAERPPAEVEEVAAKERPTPEEKSQESPGALAGLVYPAWARPGSRIAARYDNRPRADD